jgi:hypothetical protein
VHPSHLAERYGLVLIIALGEAFVAIGIGATGVGIGLGEVVAAILGLLIATAFWLAYFDFFSIRGERMLAELRGPDRIALARDVYAYAHLPMIVGIVLFAFAMKTIVAHVGEELDFAVAFALCGGSALYLLTYSGIRIRIERRVRLSSGRFVAAVALLLALPLATVIPALAGAGGRHGRLAGAPYVRARVVARGPRGVALVARVALGAGDDSLQRGDVSGEPLAAHRREPRAHTPAPLAQGSLDGDVAGFLQGRQLLRQGRVREPELLANEREVGPVGRGEERDDLQSRRRVDELVEAAVRGHRTASRRLAPARIAAITRGPPRRMITATSTLAIVAGCSAPSALAASAAAIVTPARPTRQPNTISGACRPATSRRTLTLPVCRRPASSRCETAE